MRLVLLGAGRIGRLGAGNVHRHPRAELHAVVDVVREAAVALASLPRTW